MNAQSPQGREAGFEDLRSGTKPKGFDRYVLYHRARRHAPKNLGLQWFAAA